MPSPLAITLHASASEVASGSGTVVDLLGSQSGGPPPREALELTLDVTTGTGTVKVESAPTASGPWLQAHEFAISASPVREENVALAPVSRFVRVSWAVTTGPLEFEVAGVSRVIYVRPADIAGITVPGYSLDSIDAKTMARACIDASSKAHGFFARRYSGPLTSWGSDVRRELAHIVTYLVLSGRGFDPDAGTNELIRDNYKDALKWIGQVGAGTVTPDIVDTTPMRSGSGARIYSRLSSCARVGDEDC